MSLCLSLSICLPLSSFRRFFPLRGFVCVCVCVRLGVCAQSAQDVLSVLTDLLGQENHEVNARALSLRKTTCIGTHLLCPHGCGCIYLCVCVGVCMCICVIDSTDCP